MIKTRYNLTVRFIRTNEECIFNDRYVELIRDIIIESFISNIPEQNNVVERSKEVIIRKVYCLRIIINLSINL